MRLSGGTARRMWTLFEPVHLVVYFATEARRAFEQAGLRGFWRGYFAGRAAPLGPVAAAPVTASFYNFAPSMVSRALPAVWELISPAEALAVRSAGAVSALRRLLRELNGSVAETADMLAAAAGGLDCAGRVLAAANAALPVPDEPIARLWHAATVLREHRGDGHFAALLAADIDGCEALLLRPASGVRRELIQPLRGWTDTEWDEAAARLVDRGLLAADGKPTKEGADLRGAVELATDLAASRPWHDREFAEELAGRLTPIASACAAELPFPNPTGVPSSALSGRGWACPFRVKEQTALSPDPPELAGRPGLADLARLGDPAVIADPYPLLARLREATPFAEFGGALVVFGGYQDCSRILRDPRASSERDSSLLATPVAQRTRSFLSLDPPDHTRLRRLVAKAFTPPVVARLAPRISALTDELLAAVRAPGGRTIELVSQLAYPLPVRIISELLGVPPGDHARFAGWSAKLAHSVQPQFVVADSGDVLAEADRAGREFAEYFGELIEARRSSPADDLLTKLIGAEDAGERLTVAELISTCVLLLVAGHETTVGLISNAMLALLRHPDQFAALAAAPELAAAAVEETLRYDPPVQLTGRIARHGLTVDGAEPPDGAVLLLLLAATGRDGSAFAEPDVFDIRRGGREHLAFAAGPHFCLGAPLARLEATIALRAIASALIAPELDESALVYKPNVNLRGPERVIIGFDRIRDPVEVAAT